MATKMPRVITGQNAHTLAARLVGAAEPIPAEMAERFDTFATVDRFAVGALSHAMTTVGMVGYKSGTAARNAYAARTGLHPKSLAQWATAYGVMLASGEVDRDLFDDARTTYNRGAAARKHVRENIAGATTVDAVRGVLADAVAAQTVADKRTDAADSKRDDAPGETREARTDDGANVTDVSAQWLARLHTLARDAGDADVAHVTFSADDRAVVAELLARIANTVGAEIPLNA